MTRAMLATLVLVVLVWLAGASAADVTNGPRGWKYDEAFSLELTRKAQRGSHFGGTTTTKIRVEAFLAPEGGSLFVTRAEATPPVDLRDGVATRALFILLQSAIRQGAAEIEANTQRADPANKQFEASIAWRDPKLALREHGRTIVVADVHHLVAITGECMLPIAAAKDVEQACTAALATLDPGIAADQRVPLTMIGALAESTLPSIATAPAAEANTGTATSPTSAPSARMGEQPRIGDGGRTPMAPMTIGPGKREADRRPLYLGGGIVVLAALFWWNRRRRDRFDREDAPGAAPTESEPSSGDDDADDLHAAAHGEAPKDEP